MQSWLYWANIIVVWACSSVFHHFDCFGWMCVVCRLNRVRELFVLCFVVGTACFPFPKFAFLFPDDFARFFIFLSFSTNCCCRLAICAMYFCGPSGFDAILSGSHPRTKNRKNGSDPEPTQKYQNPGEVSKVELTHPGVAYYLLPIAPQIGYLLDIY